jgi:hypothetical protein
VMGYGYLSPRQSFFGYRTVKFGAQSGAQPPWWVG